MTGEPVTLLWDPATHRLRLRVARVRRGRLRTARWRGRAVVDLDRSGAVLDADLCDVPEDLVDYLAGCVLPRRGAAPPPLVLDPEAAVLWAHGPSGRLHRRIRGPALLVLALNDAGEPLEATAELDRGAVPGGRADGVSAPAPGRRTPG